MELSQITSLLADRQATQLSVSLLKSAENIQATVLELIPSSTGTNIDTHA